MTRNDDHGSTPSSLFLPVFWLVAAVLFLVGPIHVGFLSDDHDLIRKASQTPWFYPLEAHHWSPVVASLFKLTHAGIVGRFTWLAIAYVAHCANIALVWRLVLRHLETPKISAVAITVLFTVCAAGFEALAWSCTIGYVLLTTVILFGLLTLLSCHEKFSPRTAAKLASLQLVALLIWDWGILFAPVMALCYAISGNRPRIRNGLILLWPTFGCLGLVLAGKSFFSQSMGYSIPFSPARTAYFLLTAPLRCIYPNGSTEFYKSPLGLGLSLCIVLVLLVLSFRDLRIRATFALFVLCQLPYALLGAPESRYFYLASPFLYGAVLLSLAYLPVRKLRLAGVLALTAMSALWVFDRALLWKGASREAELVKAGIEARMSARPDRKLVVVNLPDRYGPEDLAWRPYIWRNGLSAFTGEIVRVNNPGAAYTWSESGIPAMDRGAIRERYAKDEVVEVTYARKDDWRRFVVVDFR